MLNAEKAHGTDRAYEWKTIIMLSLGFGLVGMDRYMIMPMFPILMKDLNLTYQDLGHITGSLAIAWGISSIFAGNIADRFGRRKVLCLSMVLFSLLAGISGLATGVGSLVVVRAVMGSLEGAFTPASIVATIDASHPNRQGFNIGMQQMALPLFGLGLTPIIATQLLQIVDWRWVFAGVTFPGLMLSFFMYKTLRDIPPGELSAHTATHDTSVHRWTDVFRHSNVPLCIVGMLCWLTCLIITNAFLPSYFTDYLHTNVTEMGFIVSAIGFGACVGTVTIPALSDFVGRKPMAIASTLGATLFLYLLMQPGSSYPVLFIYLFFNSLFNFSLICLTVGPLCAESVPVKLMATASGFVIGIAEIFGGGIAPTIAGYIAHHYGIEYTLYLAFGALILGFITTLFLTETAPRKIQQRIKGLPIPQIEG